MVEEVLKWGGEKVRDVVRVQAHSRNHHNPGFLHFSAILQEELLMKNF